MSENPNAKWRVVTFHQDIYGSGLDHSDSDGMILRTQLTPIMDEYDIDVVLQGHDHTYSRTFQLSGDGKNHTAYNTTNIDDNFQNENLCYNIQSDVVGGTVKNPEGTVYFEANSSTGSKFYNLIATQQDYIAERSQEWNPTYSVINVTDDTFSVTTYDASTGEQLNGSSTYTIVKEDKKVEDSTQNDNQKPQDSTQSEIQKPQSNTQKTNSTTSKTPAVKKPKKATINKLVSTKTKTAKLTWKRDKTVSGYQVAYTYTKGFKKSVKYTWIKKNSKTNVTLTKLKKGKTLYVKVRAYKTVKGKKVYGTYSNIKKVKIK